MLTVVLKRSLDCSLEQIKKTKDIAGCYEIRLDTFQNLSYKDIATLVECIDQPFILTLRKENQGGWFSNDPIKQIETLKTFLPLNPDYIDLEYNTPYKEVLKIKDLCPGVKIIASYHEFRLASKNLEKLFDFTFQWEADLYKMALMPASILDVIDMLEFTKKQNQSGTAFIGICLGEIGQLSRILAPIFLNPICYASSDESESTAPGQITARSLHDIYRYNELNPMTQIYALLGNPVDQSPSHKTHNQVMKAFGLNAIYVKIKLERDLFKPFLDRCFGLGFAGFSVTVPYKELAYEICFSRDRLSKNIKSVNTLKFDNNVWKTTNTDASGALDAIEELCPIKNKTCIILGAGGTARAVAYEAKYRGAKTVKIVNRTYDKALKLAKEFDCEAFDFKKLELAFDEPYNVLINTTTVGMTNPNTTPINQLYLDPGVVVLDAILKSTNTKLLSDAKDKGCKIISGNEMFIRQAAHQFAFWFNLDGHEKEIIQILNKTLFEKEF